MTPSLAPEDDVLSQARRRVALKLGFYKHLAVYLLVNLGLFLLGGASGHAGWHTLPLLGWGVGLALHGLLTWSSLRGEGVRERMVAAEIRHLRSRQR